MPTSACGPRQTESPQSLQICRLSAPRWRSADQPFRVTDTAKMALRQRHMALRQTIVESATAAMAAVAMLRCRGLNNRINRVFPPTMKSKIRGESNSRVYRLVVLSGGDLKEGTWYDCWTCSECGQILATGGVFERKGPGQAARLSPQDVHALICCPDCNAERMYGINQRTVRQHLRSLGA